MQQSLHNVKVILNRIDCQVAEKEREVRLLEVYNKIDAKSTAYVRGKKFKKSDLLSSNRKLRYESVISWKSARGKTVDVIAIILSDVIIFLQENNHKYYFVNLDNKVREAQLDLIVNILFYLQSGVIPLQKLLVREKAGQLSKGIYLISSNPSEPEMYELVCMSAKDLKNWIEQVREAVETCPDEDEGIPSEYEAERKLEEARKAKTREILNTMYDKDMAFAKICEDKMRAFAEMMVRKLN